MTVAPMRNTLAILAFAQAIHAVDNGLATTPQMGWNDWNAYGCNVDQTLILNTAAVMQKVGLQAQGYHYVNIDDCWAAKTRNAEGRLVANSTKFPNGMKYIGDQLHSMGFGFGIYSDAGNETCAGYPASLGHETTDADTFASWGVDYLKYDNCNNNGEDGTQAITAARYQKMATALQQSGRNILYSLCEWGEWSPWQWGPSMANSWRISGDIGENWDTTLDYCHLPEYGGYNCSVVRIASFASTIAQYAAPHGWNDLDMLEVGNGYLTDDEYVSHFSIWAMAKSPLLIGTNLNPIAASDFSILMNPAVIAVSQDPLGEAASIRNATSNFQIWAGPLVSTTGGKYQDYVAGFINTGSSTQELSASMSTIFNGTVPSSSYDVYDLWVNRLSNSEAQSLLTDGASAHQDLIYNSTKTSYADGLDQKNPMLLGKKIGSVASNGVVRGSVPAGGALIYRLRAC